MTRLISPVPPPCSSVAADGPVKAGALPVPCRTDLARRARQDEKGSGRGGSTTTIWTPMGAGFDAMPRVIDMGSRPTTAPARRSGSRTATCREPLLPHEPRRGAGAPGKCPKNAGYETWFLRDNGLHRCVSVGWVAGGGTMGVIGQRAVVIGGSIGGLAAAATLSRACPADLVVNDR